MDVARAPVFTRTGSRHGSRHGPLRQLRHGPSRHLRQSGDRTSRPWREDDHCVPDLDLLMSSIDLALSTMSTSTPPALQEGAPTTATSGGEAANQGWDDVQVRGNNFTN